MESPWSTNPEILELTRRVLQEIEDAEPLPPQGPDPVVGDFFDGASQRELAAARDDLARAQTRYAEAVATARSCGFSWGEIARLLGVSRQAVHQRFRSGGSGP